VALLSDMLYPSTTYLVTTTSHASHRSLNAVFSERKWGRWPGLQQQNPAMSRMIKLHNANTSHGVCVIRWPKIVNHVNSCLNRV